MGRETRLVGAGVAITIFPRTAMRPVFFALLGVLVAGPATGQPEPPLLNPAIADQFEVTVFASGLDFPKSMQELSDGSILVGTSKPASGNLFNSTGELLRLVDADGDGRADGSGQILYTGLEGTITSVRRAGDLVFVASAAAGAEQIAILRAGAAPSDPLTLAGTLDLDYPSGWEHTTSGMEVREVAGQSGQLELFFNVGSQFNSTPSAATVPIGGLASGDLVGDSIYRLTITDTGSTPTASGLTQIAAGLRNASGIAFDQNNGDLVFSENGIDGLTDPNEPLSADELNRIGALAIGGAVEDFGFPDDFVPYRTGGQGGPGDNPLVAFQPLPDPANGSESEGPAEIAFTPLAFESLLGRGIFVSFHGKFNLGGLANEENPLVFYDLATDSYFHFIENDQADVGHLDGLLATADSLYVADLSWTGNLTNASGNGLIYRIRAIPEPSSLLLLTLGGLGVLGYRSARRRRDPMTRERSAVGDERNNPRISSPISESVAS